ncbi:adenosylmethionine decarboxylase [Wohlfahrtiimonas larvae]|uniref:S-adenosylmethionine decarboxylase proenzyme n=1 Tax=Wohlfahrtiimonas larvae TaxID=1157986 RepID=A0ABP9MY78_9GAMM|nr:adenosylmethionine decarboxylase [Wohlfahrtiimonas larvae]
MNTQFHAHGQHIILDLYGIKPTQLTHPELIESIMLNVAKALKATILQSHLHHFGENLGVTGVLLLAESHMSIHTWPEEGFAAIDIFMCGDKDMNQAIQLFIQAFAPIQHDIKIIQRGKP